MLRYLGCFWQMPISMLCFYPHHQHAISCKWFRVLWLAPSECSDVSEIVIHTNNLVVLLQIMAFSFGLNCLHRTSYVAHVRICSSSPFIDCIFALLFAIAILCFTISFSRVSRTGLSGHLFGPVTLVIICLTVVGGNCVHQTNIKQDPY